MRVRVSHENMAFLLDGLSSKISLVPHDFIVNAIDDNVPFILCFDGSTSGGWYLIS